MPSRRRQHLRDLGNRLPEVDVVTEIVTREIRDKGVGHLLTRDASTGHVRVEHEWCSSLTVGGKLVAVAVAGEFLARPLAKALAARDATERDAPPQK